MLAHTSAGCARATSAVVRHKLIAAILYLALAALTVFVFRQVPAGFVPSQDNQYLVAFASLPDGASLERTEKVVRQMTDLALQVPGVMSAVAFPGLSINGFTTAPDTALLFIGLDEFDKRGSAELSGGAIAQRVNRELGRIEGAFSAADVNGAAAPGVLVGRSADCHRGHPAPRPATGLRLRMDRPRVPGEDRRQHLLVKPRC